MPARYAIPWWQSGNNPAASTVEDHLYGGGDDFLLNGCAGSDCLESSADISKFSALIATGRSGTRDARVS